MSILKDRNRTLTELNDFIRRFQLASGFGLRSYGKGVSSVLRSHAIVEIAVSEIVSVKELSTILNIPQSTTSRVIAQLHKEQLVTIGTSTIDLRSTSIALSVKGKADFRDSAAEENQIYHNMLSRLSSEEQKQLLKLQKQFADALGAHSSRFPDLIHPMRKNVLRITRGLKLLRGDYFHEFSLSILAWHFLALINTKKAAISAKTFCELLQAPKNTVASVLNNLEDAKLISRSKSDIDSRKQNIEITSLGSKLLKDIEARQVSELSIALTLWPTEQIQMLTRLSGLLFIEANIAESEYIISPRITIRLLKDETEFAHARSFVLQQLKQDQLPETLLQKRNHNFALFEETKLKAVCELSKNKGKVSLVSCVLDKDTAANHDRDAFIKQCRKILSMTA
jgi:DNA-binding MarR family transcriptional regulator